MWMHSGQHVVNIDFEPLDLKSYHKGGDSGDCSFFVAARIRVNWQPELHYENL